MRSWIFAAIVLALAPFSHGQVMVPIQGAPNEAELPGRHSQAELGNEERPTVAWREVFSATSEVEQAAANAVKLRFPAGGGSAHGGSGVYLGDRYVATAYHVPRGTPGRGTVNFRDGSTMPCEVVMTDKTWDQCIVQLAREHPSLPGVEIADDNPRAGEHVYSIGFGKGYRIFGGPVSRDWSSASGGGSTDWFHHQSPAVSGDSGGPVFTERGELIGCLWGTDGRRTVATGTGRFHQFVRPIFPRIAAWRQRRAAQFGGGGYCPPGGTCPPQRPPSGGGGGVPINTPPNGRPTDPSLPLDPPTQPHQPAAPGCDCQRQPGSGGTNPAEPEIDLDALADALTPKIADDDRFRGPAGPQGPAGEDGADGRDGEAGADGQVTESHLTAITQSILAAIAEDERFRGPAGPRGPEGPAGDQGPVGEPAELTAEQINALAVKIQNQIQQEIPDTRVMLVDGSSGTVLDDETYAPGEPIVLDFQNIIRSANARSANH